MSPRPEPLFNLWKLPLLRVNLEATVTVPIALPATVVVKSQVQNQVTAQIVHPMIVPAVKKAQVTARATTRHLMRVGLEPKRWDSNPCPSHRMDLIRQRAHRNQKTAEVPLRPMVITPHLMVLRMVPISPRNLPNWTLLHLLTGCTS